MDKNTRKKKAIKLIEAFFEGKKIEMKDPNHGIDDWISIDHPDYWNFLTEFISNVDKYRIL